MILPVVLYGCKTLSLTLREDPRLRVSENGVLRRIFGTKEDEVMIGGLRKLHNELHNLGIYSSSSKIGMFSSRRMRWAGNVPPMRRRGMHVGFWWESQEERDH
jgi:hypothetical protein